MPKKDGISKTFSFNNRTIKMLNVICKEQKRSQTNCIEYLIDREYRSIIKGIEDDELRKYSGEGV